MSIFKNNRTCLWLLIAVACCFLLSTERTSAQNPAHGSVTKSKEAFEATFFDGLRERGLYRLAEKHGLQQWKSSALPEDGKINLAIDLARVYTEWATASAASGRQVLWTRAHQVLQEAKLLAKKHPRKIQLDLQDALTWLTEGEQSRVEAEGATGVDKFDSAKIALRKAVSGINRFTEETENLLRRVRMQPRSSKEIGWTESELAGLVRHSTIELARTLRNQALCYPPESSDRANALTRAIETLTKPGIANRIDALGWRAEVDRLICIRLLRQNKLFTKRFNELLAASPPKELIPQFQAERIRYMIDNGDLEKALEGMQKDRTGNELHSADLSFAYLEAILAAWQNANQSNNVTAASNLVNQAVQKSQFIRSNHGPAWAIRSEMLVGRALAASQLDGSGNSDAIRLAAENLFHAGKFSEAIAAYDKAAAAASRQGDTSKAFGYQFTAAAIFQKNGNLIEAAKRFEQLAIASPKHPRAASAHRMAILCIVDNAKREKNASARKQAIADYERLLNMHVQQWPQGKTADEVYFWLGELLAASRKHSDAINAFRHVRSVSLFYPNAIRRLFQEYESELQGTTYKKKQHQIVQEATKVLQPVITGNENKYPAKWTNLQRECASALAGMHLHYSKSGIKYAEDILNAAVNSSKELPQEWEAAAIALRIEILIKTSRENEAVQLVDQLAGDNAMVLVKTLSGAIRSMEVVDDNLQAKANLAMTIVGRLDQVASQLNANSKTTLEHARASANAVLGQREKALAGFEKLATQHPKRGEFSEAIARLLGVSNNPKEQVAAIKAWHKIERKSKSAGKRWFRARYARAELLLKLDRKKNAAKLIRLTKVIHPELGGEQMQKAFQDLLIQAEK